MITKKQIPYLILIVCVLFSAFVRPYRNPDESRYVEISREMVESGNYVTPTLNYLKYLEKPPLIYWLESVPIKAFGTAEIATRSVSLMLSIISIMMLYSICSRRYSKKVARDAVLIYTSSLAFVIFSGLVAIDTVLTFFVNTSLLLFLYAHDLNKSLKKRLLIYAAATSIALALLAKGLVALVIFGGVVLIWSLLSSSFRNVFKNNYLTTAIVLFIAVALPWHIFACIENKEFFDKYIVFEHFTRFLTTEHNRSAPWYFFIIVFAVGFIPWTIFLKDILKKETLKTIRKNSDDIFLVLWVLFPIVFFSLSNSKLVGYVYIVFMPASILLAKHFRTKLEAKSITRNFAILSLFIFFAVLSIYLFKLIEVNSTILLILAIVSFVNSIYLFLKSRRRNEDIIYNAFTLFLPIICALLLSWPFITQSSAKEITNHIMSTKALDEKILSFGIYNQDIPVYSRQKVYVIGDIGELEFGVSCDSNQDWVFSMECLDDIWNKSAKFIAIARKKDFNKFLASNPNFTHKVIYETESYISFAP